MLYYNYSFSKKYASYKNNGYPTGFDILNLIMYQRTTVVINLLHHISLSLSLSLSLFSFSLFLSFPLPLSLTTNIHYIILRVSYIIPDTLSVRVASVTITVMLLCWLGKPAASYQDESGSGLL